MFTVLWDNDGVLVDTEGLYFQATQRVLQTVGIELTPEQFKAISLRRGESTFRLAAEEGFGPEEIAELRAKRDRIHAESLATRCRVIAGVEDVLRSLRGEVRMIVVTSCRGEHFTIAHANSGLLRYFDGVLTREDFTHTKPSPEPYLKALRRFDLQAEECLVVEDSERGLASAISAGLKCLVVPNTWTREGDFRGAWQVLPDISGVPAEISKLASTRQASE
ncbi:MAG: HAD family hydrolase [Planctomycetota bacterium]